MSTSQDDSLVCVYMTKQEASLYSHFSDFMKALKLNITTPSASALVNPIDHALNDWITHIDASFDKADKYISGIDTRILKIHGMSGKKTRHFYNNIASKKDIRYLEIGVLTGSSTCSMMSNNNIQCTAIDNWCEFGGPKNEFLQNIANFKGINDIKFIEANCWTIDTSKLGKFNMYLYDGPHAEIDHFEALHYYSKCLDDMFVYIIDDWNWEYVRNGTLNAIRANKFTIKYRREIRTTDDNTQPYWDDTKTPCAGPNSDWHNGICVFILSKH